MAGIWIWPFQGRNHSGAFNQNFVWKDGSIYVMDNHRAALWCWLDSFDLTKPHSLFHIDRHTDTLQSRLDVWLKHLPPSWDVSIEAYLTQSYPAEFGPIPVFSWDNYLSIYFHEFRNAIQKCYFATHKDGDDPNFPIWPVDMWHVPENLDYWIDERNAPWIFNVDLDYFFCPKDEGAVQMVSDDYVRDCFSTIKKLMDAGTVIATTICLSPDDGLTGGWDSSERLARIACECLGVSFSLPPD